MSYMNYTTISIKDIAVDCVIGVSAEERKKKQTVLVSVKLVVDAEKASQTDNLQNALVDYKKVYDKTRALVAGSRYYLLEKLARMLLETYLQMPGVFKAGVTVEKPHRLPDAQGVSVRMEGERV